MAADREREEQSRRECQPHPSRRVSTKIRPRIFSVASWWGTNTSSTSYTASRSIRATGRGLNCATRKNATNHGRTKTIRDAHQKTPTHERCTHAIIFDATTTTTTTTTLHQRMTTQRLSKRSLRCNREKHEHTKTDHIQVRQGGQNTTGTKSGEENAKPPSTLSASHHGFT